METVSKVRTEQAALMLVLAGTLWGCGGSNDAAVPAPGTQLAPATTAVSTEASTADSAGTADSASPSAGEGLVADAAAADEFGAAHASKDIYGIINLASPPESRARINNLGQALFEYVGLDNLLHLGFFNGERSFDINPPNAPTALGGLNEKGEVTAYAILPTNDNSGQFQVFRWTAKGGRVFLPSLNAEGNTFSGAINNRGEIVGSSKTGSGNSVFRAVRWTAKNHLIPLPLTAGFSGQSLASDINEQNVTVGSADDASGNPHVFVWDAATHPTNLGTFGAENAFAVLNNNRGDIVGHLDFFGPNFQAFFWSPGKGAVRVGHNTLVGDLNESGVLVGQIRRPNDENHAYLFTRKRGLVDLHPAKFFSSGAGDVNESGVVVGEGMRTAADIGRALRWSPTGVLVDLNTRLLNPPSGLVVTSAFRINDKGDLLAQSNAGLVYLRLGGGGTDAPVLGPIQINEPRLNEVTRLTLSFRDRNVGNTHKATVDWGDGSGPQPATVHEYKGKGEVSAMHTYVIADIFNIVVRVTDSTGKTTMLYKQISISPPRP